MATAVIYSVSTGNNSEFQWKWRCESENRESAASFALYYDCLSDARARGYRVEAMEARGDSAPGGPGYSLGDNS
jgi:hypothetical protein